MTPLAFLQNLSSWEIVLIFLVVLLFFGAKRLPELFRSFGKSMREFKKATTDIEDDIRTAMDEEPKPAHPAPERVEPESASSASSEETNKA
ncbi:MAG: Sec-independent protein translocase subunit TatA/TatB [Opitutales bacterium]